jgi:hypothetical protein
MQLKCAATGYPDTCLDPKRATPDCRTLTTGTDWIRKTLSKWVVFNKSLKPHIPHM